MEKTQNQDETFFSSAKQVKQRINFSGAAFETVRNDALEFPNDEHGKNLSNFLNVILPNFYEEAESTLYFRLIDERNRLNAIFPANPWKEENLKRLLKSKEDELSKHIIERVHEKGESFFWSVNEKNSILLRQTPITETCRYSIYQNGGRYLKALFEEYAQKTRAERELIFNKDMVDAIKACKPSRGAKKLKITLNPRTAKDGRKSQQIYYFSVYDLLPDKSKQFNYLLGVAEERFINGRSLGKEIKSFRLSNIAEIKILAENAFIKPIERQNLKKSLSLNGPSLIAESSQTIRIRFTERGLNDYHRWVYLRPNTIAPTNDPLVFDVLCNTFTADAYFFKFGPEIEIISPENIRKLFHDKYQKALSIYERDEKTSRPINSRPISSERPKRRF